jgi:hypothetical protein
MDSGKCPVSRHRIETDPIFPSSKGPIIPVREEQQKFMSLVGQPPARLTVEQAAWVLGCQPHDIPILVAARLLRPLGNPPPNGVKFFCTSEVLELLKNRSWLAKMTSTINQYWQRKNVRQKSRSVKASEKGRSSLVDLATTVPVH